jgi:hypothetical protein
MVRALCACQPRSCRSGSCWCRCCAQVQTLARARGRARSLSVTRRVYACVRGSGNVLRTPTFGVAIRSQPAFVHTSTLTDIGGTPRRGPPLRCRQSLTSSQSRFRARRPSRGVHSTFDVVIVPHVFNPAQ